MSTNYGRIYMDSDMLESYANYNEAADHFLHGIALENITLDTEIQIEFGISDDDVFSDYAMEAIGETVKNMASKAKSNFVTYAKKLINFLFGWLIKFFQGTTNVKKAMRASYEKATTYLKKLNELERKARGADKEQQIEITDWGNCVLVGLTMIQVIIISTQNLGAGLREAASNTANDNGDGKNNSTTRGFKMMDVLLKKLETLFGLVSSIDISKPQALIQGLRAANYDIAKMVKTYESHGKDAVKSARLDVQKEAQQAPGSVKNENDANNYSKNTRQKVVNKLEGTYKQRLEDTAKYMSEPNKTDMSISDAYDELRTKLKLFIDLSKANKWDLEKNISSAEKIRRGLEKEINAIDLTTVNEKDLSLLLQRIVSVGNNLGQIQRSAGIVVKQVARCIEGLTVDVAKLGSKVIKMGDTE